MDLSFTQMRQMQQALQEKYKEKWGGLSPEKGRSMLLWMIGEAGEVADVIKQNGDEAIMADPGTRSHFVEEMCDVLMYFADIMLCYGISPEELAQMYTKKYSTNMQRW